MRAKRMMLSEAQREQYEEIARSLIGSATTPHDVNELMRDESFCHVLDKIAFLCVDCGWWCDISEEAAAEYDLEEWTCRACCEGSQ